jgi:hypothetical protein
MKLFGIASTMTFPEAETKRVRLAAQLADAEAALDQAKQARETAYADHITAIAVAVDRDEPEPPRAPLTAAETALRRAEERREGIRRAVEEHAIAWDRAKESQLRTDLAEHQAAGATLTVEVARCRAAHVAALGQVEAAERLETAHLAKMRELGRALDEFRASRPHLGR